MSISSVMRYGMFIVACLGVLCLPASFAIARSPTAVQHDLDKELQRVLANAGFTGNVESTLQTRLGRRLDPRRAEVGRMLWFDTITGLNDDNTCAGCHSPTAGFGDTQSIAIGIENNGIVGPHRAGPRNMRRTPMIINNAFYPTLMWNSRFRTLSGDPFDNRSGFLFPPPEVLALSHQSHLLAAQAFIPPTERTEVTGFDFEGDNHAIRAEVLNRLNAIPAYRELFGKAFEQVKRGAPIDFDMFGQAIAEFEFTLTFANAPIDRFTRGERGALTTREKKGALLFFGKAQCIQCHSVAGASNEMFSDFREHVIGVPQIVPHETNNTFDGPDLNQDFGKEQVSGDSADRYMFRTSPLRNVALQPTFMHNGAFTRLEDAIRHHLDVVVSIKNYSPAAQELAQDFRGPIGPMRPVLKRLDPIVAKPIHLSGKEFRQLVAFVRNGLLDPRARYGNLQRLIPIAVPSGRPVLVFQAP
jgi:cytochrome c peroxidase